MFEVVELHVVMPHEELYFFDVDFAGRIVFVECVNGSGFPKRLP